MHQILSFDSHYLFLGEQKCYFFNNIKLNQDKKFYIHCKVYKSCKQ